MLMVGLRYVQKRLGALDTCPDRSGFCAHSVMPKKTGRQAERPKNASDGKILRCMRSSAVPTTKVAGIDAPVAAPALGCTLTNPVDRPALLAALSKLSCEWEGVNVMYERCGEGGLPKGCDGVSVRVGFSARWRRAGMIPGAFERQRTISKRIPCGRQRPARPTEHKSPKLRVAVGSEGAERGCRRGGQQSVFR